MGGLLSRASEGPALVVAPTSVCGNWASEIRRFAPSLDPTIFGGGDREAAIASAGAGSVIIVSYGPMLQEQKLFASLTWSTLVADEAQAVKNAGAKRSWALFALDAGFRLALSGTPIENRLSELWSIMRFCNPGLL
jgi:SNF2 family DNA or RNA helicase